MGQGTALVLVAVAAGGIVALGFWELRRLRRLQVKVGELQKQLAKANTERAAERTGRIRAQKELRKKLIGQTQPDSSAVASVEGQARAHAPGALVRYPMVPIGTVHSCFMTRNGTPRQPCLAQHARACVQLHPSIPPAALEGLQDFSHCWVLYLFHANTDIPRLWDPQPHSAVSAKVRVPRLEGGRRGCLATRSPHRPLPIGLSVAKVERVEGRKLFITGADIVDGTPVLDVKPYLPYCDIVEGAKAPAWAQVEDGPLAVHQVLFEKSFADKLSATWGRRGSGVLFNSQDEFATLVKDVLSRDIRSYTQRKNPHAASRLQVDPERAPPEQRKVKTEKNIEESSTTDTYASTAECRSSGSGGDEDGVLYHVQLDQIEIGYLIRDQTVTVVSAAPLKRSQGNG